MPLTLERCARLLSEARVRHHVDAVESVVRLVFVTRQYHNLRGERLAIAQIALPDGGRRCRVTLERAFAVDSGLAEACLAFCRAAAATPLVGVECDPESENIRLVVESAVEDGLVTRRQLLAMVDAVIEAAEIWHAALRSDGVATLRRAG